MTFYKRTHLLSFSELPKYAQIEALSYNEDPRDSQYVCDPCDGNGYLALDNFERSNGKFWDGHFGQSYFSGYFIKFSKTDYDLVTIAYRHW